MIQVLLFLIAAAPLGSVRVPAGTFEQGSTRAPDEQPVRMVRLDGFAIDATEVQVSEFEKFLGGGWHDDHNWSVQGLAWRKVNPRGAGRELRAAGRDGRHPVVSVTWYEADAYCRSVGGALPTEAQWERAACNGQPGPYPWGSSETVPAQWALKSGGGGVMRVDTAPVDEDKVPAPLGLRHMSGNVWEWTADWYHRDSYSDVEEANPIGRQKGTWKTIRGGSFMNLPSYSTCTHREPTLPDDVRLTLGFRCAYTLD
jgi:formylglycine-generating enzyme required for sulfatase activity